LRFGFALLLGLLALPGYADGGVYGESFDTETATTEETVAVYPTLSLNKAMAGMAVKDGVLTAPSGGRVMVSLPRLEPGPAVVELDIGASDDSRSSSVMVEVMKTNIVFHPGYPAEGGFRVDGVLFNQRMGFVPAINVLHYMKISTDGKGHFDVEVVDGVNRDNVYRVSFFNPEARGDEVRLQCGNRAMLFDNIRIEGVALPVTPETAAGALSGGAKAEPAMADAAPPPEAGPDAQGLSAAAGVAGPDRFLIVVVAVSVVVIVIAIVIAVTVVVVVAMTRKGAKQGPPPRA